MRPNARILHFTIQKKVLNLHNHLLSSVATLHVLHLPFMVFRQADEACGIYILYLLKDFYRASNSTILADKKVSP